MKEKLRGRNGDRREAYGSPCSPAGAIGLSRGPRGHVTRRAEGFLRLRLIRTLFTRGLVPRGVQLQPLRECEAKSGKEMYTEVQPHACTRIRTRTCKYIGVGLHMHACVFKSRRSMLGEDFRVIGFMFLQGSLSKEPYFTEFDLAESEGRRGR